MRKREMENKVLVRVCECEREDLSVTAKGKYADSKVKKNSRGKIKIQDCC